ncbi:MAG: NAD-dependent epimerase/dehydratase family protein [Filimonas sp.]|nr:NAD-dependent epimerase/dehydratase family protein [Filimonas sp.]
MRNIIHEDVEKVIAGMSGWERFRNKVVLISGASGFLPAYMVEVLMHLNSAYNMNVKVIALVRNIDKAHKRFEHFLSNALLQIEQHDVCLPYSTQEKIDFIVHAASQASPKFYGVDPVGTLNANVLGTNNLLTLAKEHKVEKFLYFSSSEVYGQLTPDKIPTKETEYGYIDPMNVRACYGESKRMGETMCVSWSHQFGVPVSIVRPFHTYGPGMDLNDGRVYADFIADIVNNRNIVMKSDGSAIRAFCYVGDAAAAFFTVLLNGENQAAYNVGNAYGEISILELAERLVALFPAKRLSVIKKADSEDNKGYINSLVSRIVPSMEKITMLGWMPQTGIEEGFSRTIKSYA